MASGWIRLAEPFRPPQPLCTLEPPPPEIGIIMKRSTLFRRMVAAVALAGFAVAGLGFTHVIQRDPGDVTGGLARPAAVHGPGDFTGG